MKSLQIFRNSTLIMRVNDEGGQEMKEIMEEKQLQVFYKSLMEVYSKIEKINDNGRQLIILDSDEIFKILKDIGVQAQAWHHWFYKYLSLAQSKKYKLLMEDISKLGLLYPPVCWKSSIMYVISDFSTKQRKEYGAFLARFYATALRDSQM